MSLLGPDRIYCLFLNYFCINVDEKFFIVDLMDIIKYVIWKSEHYTFVSIWKDDQIRKIFNKQTQKGCDLIILELTEGPIWQKPVKFCRLRFCVGVAISIYIHKQEVPAVMFKGSPTRQLQIADDYPDRYLVKFDWFLNDHIMCIKCEKIKSKPTLWMPYFFISPFIYIRNYIILDRKFFESSLGQKVFSTWPRMTFTLKWKKDADA